MNIFCSRSIPAASSLGNTCSKRGHKPQAVLRAKALFALLCTKCKLRATELASVHKASLCCNADLRSQVHVPPQSCLSAIHPCKP